jgi:hypothetical protein
MDITSQLIKTTRLIRKRSPIKCHKGDQGAHLVGLNLAKELFNYYVEERNMAINEPELEELIRDINDKSNFACETKQENIDDKGTEAEVLDMLFQGHLSYNDMSTDAQLMFNRLKALLDEMSRRRPESKRFAKILRELSSGEFPLPRHCANCNDACFVYESTTMIAFCDVFCQIEF